MICSLESNNMWVYCNHSVSERQGCDQATDRMWGMQGEVSHGAGHSGKLCKGKSCS